MKFFTPEALNPKEKTLEFIRQFAYNYTPGKGASSEALKLRFN